jgi:hypothetical protein
MWCAANTTGCQLPQPSTVTFDSPDLLTAATIRFEYNRLAIGRHARLFIYMPARRQGLWIAPVGFIVQID